MLFRISSVKIAATLAITLAISAPALAQDMKGMDMSGHDMSSMSDDDAMDHDMHMGNGNMKNMSLHMAFTDLRTSNDSDKARAAVLVTDLQHALAKYKDYHVAEADGFKPFHPEFKQPVVHFTRNWNGLKAAFTFDPNEPTSLLYQRTGDGGYKLIGAMYTDHKGATVDQLDQRVPLSVARWHRHINLCFPPRGTEIKSADWTKFGFNGSIATKDACDAAGGRFFPQVFGWMVHVYPWETNPQLVWAH
jgi:hypothetical protein